MAKKLITIVKLALEAGKATPAPPVGPALGQHGVNIALFCKEYNAKTADQGGLIIPVEISIYDDRTFTFILKTPPASVLIKKALNIPKRLYQLTLLWYYLVLMSLLEEIAKIKLPDLNTNNIDSAIKIIEGTAINMGISIK